MEKTMSEQMRGALEEKFAKYKKLADREKGLRARLKKAQDQRNSVSDKIYEKVKRDYEKQLAETEAELAPIEEEIAEARESTARELSALEIGLSGLEEQHSEALFRHSVGEFDKTKLAEIEDSLLPQIEEKRSRKEPLLDLLAKIESAAAWESDGTGEAPTGAAKKIDNPDIKRKTGAEKTQAAADHSMADDIISELADPLDETLETDEKKKSEQPADEQLEKLSVTAVGDPASADAKREEPSDDPRADEKPKADEKPEADTDSPAIPFPNMIITSGSHAGKKIPLLPMTMTIGREHDNNIEIKDEEVARYHARVLYQDGQFKLQDLNSSTGTWVNDEKITEVTLKNADKIRFGNIEMVIDFN